MPASQQAGARSPFVLSPSSHKRPVRKDRAFVVFPNEAGLAAGTGRGDFLHFSVLFSSPML